jgi:tetratricopeptide (TPR) repeat protein
MRPVLWGLLIVVVCMPLAFVLFLVTAAKYPVLDPFTMKLPSDVRAAVADLTLRKAGVGKDSAKLVNRAIELDPESADAWGRRCHGDDNRATYDQGACRKAIALDPSAWNYSGLGTAQEDAKDFCAAEDSYTSAIKASQNSAYYLRNMARAALRCGHTGAAIAGFEVAEGLDAKAVADPNEDDDVKTDLLSDREYLVVAYDRTTQPAKAAAICAKAHGDWRTCQCVLTDTDVKCSGAPVEAASKK